MRHPGISQGKRPCIERHGLLRYDGGMPTVPETPSPTLADVLHPQNNNTELFRLIAACAVIYGHAYAIAAEGGRVDFVTRAFGFEYTGSLAVKFFFFLSGILVTNSLLEHRSAVRFAIARVARIFPGLIVGRAVVSLLLGPALTTLSWHDYFANSWVIADIFRHPHNGYALPGLFEGQPQTAANGSLWTISYELRMYFILFCVWLIGLLRGRMLATVVCAALALSFAMRPTQIAEIGLPENIEAGRMAGLFFLGALLAVQKHRVPVSGKVALGLVLAAWMLRPSGWFPWAMYLAVVYGMLWLSCHPWLRRLRPPGDFSYGVYVYGWPVQQAVHTLWPGLGIGGNQIVSLTAALLFGAASWYSVERPCIALGRAVTRRVEPVRGWRRPAARA